MPELPDILLYLKALEDRIVGHRLNQVRLRSPFFLRTFVPEIEACHDRVVIKLHRLGKRIVWELEDEVYLIFHLMIAGRFQWKKPNTLPKGKMDLASFWFDEGSLVVTEASQKKRASLHVVAGADTLSRFDRQALDVLDCTLESFGQQLTKENHTLKRALTDPDLFSGIGNAYSDEILHAAGLSPFRWTQKLTDEQIARLFEATTSILRFWITQLQQQAKGKFPSKVTAFRPEMAVHGKYGQPCPKCQTIVQRVVYAENEMNYCPRCQTQGKVLADRSLSKLLKGDWPSTIEEWERDQT